MYEFLALIKVGNTLKEVTVKAETYRSAVPLILVCHECNEIDIVYLARDKAIV